MARKRYLEINQDGYAFHEPGLGSPFSRGESVPPKEILFCDCEGIGTNCHHRYEDGAEERHLEVYFSDVEEWHRDEWLADHKDPECKIRRQFFVDVTSRKNAIVGMKYDEQNDRFFWNSQDDKKAMENQLGRKLPDSEAPKEDAATVAPAQG